MRKWARNTGRAALVAAGALVVGGAFGTASAATPPGDAFSSLAHRYGGGYGYGGEVNQASFGNVGLGNGNQVSAPISIPVDVCGNAIAIGGVSKAGCIGGASVTSGEQNGYRQTGGALRHGGDDELNQLSYGNVGVGNGNQVHAPINVPISVCGNAVAVFGYAQAGCHGGASVERGNESEVNQASVGNVGMLNGNQVHAPINAPVSVCGIAVGAVNGVAGAGCAGGSIVEPPDDQLPPTLRTPEAKKPHKTYKPSKNRPAAGKKPLPSTLRGSAYRMASPGAPDYRSAKDLPAVQELLDTLKRGGAPVSGVDVQPGDIGPELPATIGAPLLG
ncbi:MAG TPA: chaplin [Spirillospora sp.]